MLQRMALIGPTYSSQFMEWHNLGITTLAHAICVPIVAERLIAVILPEAQIATSFIDLISSNFVATSNINY